MEKRINYNPHILFLTNRILSFAAICFFYKVIDDYYQEAWINLSFGGYSYFAIEILVGIFMGVLLGWFLCDTISITGNKYMNVVLIIILAILASYKVIYFLSGNIHGMAILSSGSLSMILVDLAKYFQRGLGICIFLMAYGKIKAKFSHQEIPEHEEAQEGVGG